MMVERSMELGLNSLWALTLWWMLPLAAAVILRERAPEAQRRLVRFCLWTAPCVVALVLTGAVPVLRAPLIDLPVIDLTDIDLPDIDLPGEVLESVATLPADSGVGLPQVEERAAEAPESNPPEFYDGLALATPHLPGGFSEAAVGEAPVTGPGREPVQEEEFAESPTVAMTTGALPKLAGVLALLWLGVTLFGFTRLFSSQRTLSRWAIAWRQLTGAPLDHVRRLARNLTYSRRFHVYSSTSLNEAAALGIRRPAIVLPEAWARRLGQTALDPLVLHEIAHLRSRDPLWRVVGWALAIAFWPHPLVHWLRRREQDLSEYAADALVLRSGAQRRDYARLLGRVAEAQVLGLPCSGLAVGVLGPRHQLEGRIRMILDSNPRRGRVSGAVLGLGAALVLTFSVTQPLVGRCDPCPPNPAEPPVLPEVELFVSGLDANELFFVGSGEEPCPPGETGIPPLALPRAAQALPQAKLSNSQAQIARLTDRLAKAELELARAQALFERGLTSPDEVAALTAQCADLRATIEAHESDLKARQVEIDLWLSRSATDPRTSARQRDRQIEAQHALMMAMENARQAGDLEAARKMEAELKALGQLRAEQTKRSRDLLRAREIDLLESRPLASRRNAQRAYEEALHAQERVRRQQEQDRAAQSVDQARALLGLVAEKKGRLSEADLERVMDFLRATYPKEHRKDTFRQGEAEYSQRILDVEAARRNEAEKAAHEAARRFEAEKRVVETDRRMEQMHRMMAEMEAMRQRMMQMQNMLEQERADLEALRRKLSKEKPDNAQKEYMLRD